ncbi:MAG: contractile injection system protein, VgrG/Pvc8 family [Gammaproteobacteria bacterium]
MQGLNAQMPVNAFLECEGRSFRIKSGHITEAICRSFDAQVTFSASQRFEASTFLGKFCTLTIEDTHGEKRTWVGECQSITSHTDDGLEWHYTFIVESILSRLKKSQVHFRTEVEVDLKNWVKAMFKRHRIESDSLEWRFNFREVRPRLVQVLQNDYDFLLKILAQENIIMWPATDKQTICFADYPDQWKYGSLERIFYTGTNDIIQHGGEKVGVFDYQDCYQLIRSGDEEDTRKDWENKSPERLYSGVPYLLEGMGGPALKPCKQINYDHKSMEALFRRRATSKYEEGDVYRYLDATSNAIAVAVGNWISLVDINKNEETRGRLTYVKHELTSSGKTLRYQNRFLMQPAMSLWRAVSPLKPTLPLVMQAYIEGNDSAPSLNPFGEEQISFPGDAAEKPQPFEIPRMRSFVNHEGGMSFPLGHRTEVLISFLYGEGDLPIIVGAVPNVDTPCPVNGLNPLDHVLSTRSGHKLRMHDDPANASVGLETSPSHGLWMQNGKGINLRSEGGFVMDVKGRILCQIGKSWNMLAGGSMTCTAGLSHTFETKEGDMTISSPMNIDTTVQKCMSLYLKSNMKMRDKNFKMKVDKDATITVKNGETRYQIKGAVSIQGGDGIRIIGGKRIVLQSGNEGSGFIVEPDQITMYGKNLVGIETNALELNGNVSFGSSQRVSSPVQALKNTIAEESEKEIKKLVLHGISVTDTSEFYGMKVASGELDEFFFHIADEAMTIEEFVENLYQDPEDAHVSNFKTVNSHVKGVIEPGQMVYITNASGAVFQKFKSELARSASIIDSLRIEIPKEEVACFAQNFALLGSFASSAGAREGVYKALENPNESATAEKLTGMIPFVTDAFLQYLGASISGKMEAYDRSDPSNAAFRSDMVKNRDTKAIKMMDGLISPSAITASIKIDAVLKASNAEGSWMRYSPQNWITQNLVFLTLDEAYQCIMLAQKAMNWWGNLHLLMDISDKHRELELACVDLSEEKCRRLNVEHWSKFTGKTTAEFATSKSLGIVLQWAGKNIKHPCVSMALIGAGAVLPNIKMTPDEIGERASITALAFHDLYYEDAKVKMNEYIDNVKEKFDDLIR